MISRLKRRGGETLCHLEMELDLQEKDQEQAGDSEEAVVVGARADHDLELEQAVTASAHLVER